MCDLATATMLAILTCSCLCSAAVILTVESEEEEESDSSETEKEDDEGIIFVARATSEVLQEGKVSGNGLLPTGAGSFLPSSLMVSAPESSLLLLTSVLSTQHLSSISFMGGS